MNADEARNLMENSFLPLPDWYKKKIYKAIKESAKEGYSGVNIKPVRFIRSFFGLEDSEPQYEHWGYEMIKILKQDGYNVFLKKKYYSYETNNQLSISWNKDKY